MFWVAQKSGAPDAPAASGRARCGAGPFPAVSIPREVALSRAIVTIIGSDRVGIIAGVTTTIAEAGVNILDISQSVIREFFTMIMMVEMSGASVTYAELRERLSKTGEELGVRVEIQREEIFQAMHRI